MASKFKIGKKATKKGSRPFKLKRGVKPPKPKERTARAPKLKDPADEPPFFVKGQQAGSKDEYWTSLALDKIEEEKGWGWAYQVPVYGGRRRRGGQVVDFLLYTPSRWTIIDVKGRYWHTGRREDQREIEDVARKENWNLIGWFTDETPTKDSVYQRLRQELHI